MAGSPRVTGSTPRERPRQARSRRSPAGASRAGKVRKAFWLDPQLLGDARLALGAATEREAVEMALDLVAFRRELARGARAVRGLGLSRLD
jgi:hypothetical protein